MNSVQRQILTVLDQGARRAIDVLAALRLIGFKGEIEAVYGELASLEATQHVCIEGVYDGTGQRLASVWAVGHQRASRVPDSQAPTSIVDALHIFGRPTPEATEPPAGVLIHRCL